MKQKLFSKEEQKELELLFSERLNLQEEFFEWAKKNNVDSVPMNVIGWLNSKYIFINKGRS